MKKYLEGGSVELLDGQEGLAEIVELDDDVVLG